MKTFYVCVFSLISFTSAMVLQRQSESNNQDIHGTQYSECLNETYITPTDLFTVDDIMYERYKEPGNEEKIRKHGCVLHCSLEKTGQMVGSEINVEQMHNGFLTTYGEKKGREAIKVVDDCINITKDFTEKCHKAFHLMMCFLRNLRNLQQTSTVNEEHAQGNE
ncbi:pheromone-binding protein Gp-9-like isoform X1 [Harpegnathos saltator]|uniref:pheromone-binding protein Gp-9-like isoform X1 n=1 Tax=Harpegnathos saltator TaxID=610380 RepID=UPI00058E504A|nr:pheromone-binding protein Gp-9-like isoform X1 [Harpegnathos saltator]